MRSELATPHGGRVPVTLDVSPDLASELSAGASLALRDPEGVMLAVLRVDDVWEPDRRQDAARVGGIRPPLARAPLGPGHAP